jgi:hypothetical protein
LRLVCFSLWCDALGLGYWRGSGNLGHRTSAIFGQ